MSNKEKPANKSQPKSRELEKRVEEEQRKLAELKKRQENEKKNGKKQPQKGKAQKKQKGDKDISDKVNAKAGSKKAGYGMQNSLDYHRFLEGQQRKLDYAALFSYLGGGVKGYEYCSGEHDIAKIIQKKEETIPWETVKFYIDEHKMNKIIELERSWQTNDEREAYKWWKAFHNLMSYMLFDLSMT